MSRHGCKSAVPEVVIFSPGFSASSGGAVALHLLCHRLRQRGISAMLWHSRRPHPRDDSWGSIMHYWLRKMLYELKRSTIRRDSFTHNPIWDTQETANLDQSRTWVVYPDIEKGNPLGASNVVRWYLYKHNPADYKKDNIQKLLNVFFSPNFSNGGQDDHFLSCHWIRRDLFNKNGAEKKTLKCHMYRKKDADLIPIHDNDSVCLDGMSINEIAEIFRRAKLFISYDLHTAYSMYAVLSGCDSVVAKKTGLSLEKWRVDESSRYGIAYGFENLAWAQSTSSLLEKTVDSLEEREKRELDLFIASINNLSDSRLGANINEAS